ncbi:hypothetical protein SAMN05216354_1833 [Xylanibacter ruminicola]|uniref:Uncharacterized protein n=1 Tax=Xylanibacter ruminicola TaxID=839 RepID=A0A1H5VA18_XYLRU|nr:hypothetical protein [Xylanibacter ruminicola]SEF84060.1 hypothetical protein SAMN05216354_1833 [Xylanibacter ruminicola]
MKTILDLSSEKAFRYFMERENYCTQELPVYINFKPVLDFMEKTLENVTEEEVLDGVKPWHRMILREWRLTTSRRWVLKRYKESSPGCEGWGMIGFRGGSMGTQRVLRGWREA